MIMINKRGQSAFCQRFIKGDLGACVLPWLELQCAAINNLEACLFLDIPCTKTVY